VKNIIGIRREDKNPWERRVPLIPSHIRELIRHHRLRFYIQPSKNRCFADEDFRLEGCGLRESLRPCSVILGVKEIPPSFFEKGKTYLFFSHTVKGQPQNMPMLRRMADLGCTLIDYEKIVDGRGRRLVFFGRQAGAAGMIDTLWALGRRLKVEGVDSPFLGLRQTMKYKSLVEAKEEVAEVGIRIRTSGLPPSMVPFVCGFTGYGHVSQGAQEIFDILPVDEIGPEEFSAFFRARKFSPYRVYKTVFREEHMAKPRGEGRSFDLEEYYLHPDRYGAVLEKYLPRLTVLINGIYWAPRYPRFVTKKFIRKLYAGPTAPRLKVIGDISCDVEGGVECTIFSTTPKEPAFVYEPDRDAARPGFEGRGPVVVAVYNFPAEIPLESSVFFSQVLKPFVPAIAEADFSGSFSDCRLPMPVRRAVILYKGKLTPRYRYMRAFLEPREAGEGRDR